MSRLLIRHETHYTYDRPVGFTPHRLLLRPRDSHAIRVVSASLELFPHGQTRWVYDALGNCVCWYRPEGEAAEMRVVSNLVIDRFPAPLTPMVADDPHSTLPIVYELNDRLALAPFITPVTPDEDGALLSWLRAHMQRGDEPVLDFITRLNTAIFQEFTYASRYAEGVQSPGETLSLGAGACRDFAWLMVEGLRHLGFAAQFVTGYLYSPANAGVRGAGATHAWCAVFLPNLGWLEFDPTNGLVESPDLIQVAATRSPAEAAPVAGGLIGDPGKAEMTVLVDVNLAQDNTRAA